MNIYEYGKIAEILAKRKFDELYRTDDFLEFRGAVIDDKGQKWECEGSMEVDADNTEISYSIVFFHDDIEMDGITETVKVIDGDFEKSIDYIISPNFVELA